MKHFLGRILFAFNEAINADELLRTLNGEYILIYLTQGGPWKEQLLVLNTLGPFRQVS